MPYVQRADDGRIAGIFSAAQPGVAEEWLDNAELEPSLEDARATALSALAAAVSAMRAKYAGAITGQDLIYNMKLAEAQAYVSAGRPADASPFPVLAASAEGRGKSVSEEADAVLATAQAWIALGAESERLRLAGQKAVTEADTLEAIYGARDEYAGRLAAL